MSGKEKNIERNLRKKVEKLGGLALKLPTIHFAGLPDRLCLFPGGRVLFVETKSKGDRPRKIQTVVHKKLTQLGFRVEVIDNEKYLNIVMLQYE